VKFYTKLLIYFLCFHIAFGSSLLAVRPAFADDGDVAAREDSAWTEQLVRELEQAGPEDFPRGTPDSFHLTGQELIVYSQQRSDLPRFERYALDSIQVDLPSVVADFDREVSIDTSGGGLSILFKKNSVLVAEHRIPNLNVKTYAVDREMLQFVDPSGALFVIDMAYARGEAFHGPLPVYRIGSLPPKTALENLKVAFGSRGFKAPTVIPEDAVLPQDLKERDLWTAGDFIVYRDWQDGTRELVGVYDRGVSLMQMHSGNAIVSFLATMASPPDDVKEMQAAVAALADENITAQAQEALQGMDPATREVFTAFSPKSVENLRGRSAAAKARSVGPRDQYTTEELVASFDSIVRRAQAESDSISTNAALRDPQKLGDLEEAIAEANLTHYWQPLTQKAVDAARPKRSLFYRAMHSNAMKLLAFAVGLGAAGTGLAYARLGHGPAWAIHLGNYFYANYWPDVLKNAAYRFTLLKSSLALSAFIPALWVIGTVYAAPRAWSVVKGICTIGIRAYAETQLPFLARLATLARQPTFIPSLQMGLNPFSKLTREGVKAKSPSLLSSLKSVLNRNRVKAQEGGFRPGLTTGKDTDVRFKRNLLREAARQKSRLRAYSWLLANLAVAERRGLDPATLALVQAGAMDSTSKVVRDLANDPGYLKEWTEVAREIHGSLAELREGMALGEFTSIPPEQLEKDFEMARKAADQIGTRGFGEKAVAKFRSLWRGMGARIAKGIGNWGQEEYLFLRDVEPSKFVSTMTWRQFVVDYVLSVGQEGLFGARANLAKPSALAADPNGAFWSQNSRFWTNRAHFGDMSEQVAIYALKSPSQNAQVYQKDTQPEESSYDPIEFITLQGMPRPESYIRGIGKWIMAALSLSKADYGTYFLKRFVRSMRSIQGGIIMSMACRVLIANQSPSQAFWATIYLTLWGQWAYGWLWQPINRGNGIYQENSAEENAAFLAAKSQIARGLRLGNSEETRAGFETLKKFYGRKGEADRLIQENGSDGTVEDQARFLLRHSLKHPPIFTQTHPFVEWSSTFVGAILTTYWATSMYVTSYDPSALTLPLLGKIALTSGALYGGLYFGQKLVIDKLAARIHSAIDGFRARKSDCNDLLTH
jgi:hypothetical protein